LGIFSSVLRNVNPNHPTLAEDLAIDADLIRQIHKDCGHWYFNDVNFGQTLQITILCLGVMLTKYSLQEL
jgi:hypothetical protein